MHRKCRLLNALLYSAIATLLGSLPVPAAARYEALVYGGQYTETTTHDDDNAFFYAQQFANALDTWPTFTRFGAGSNITILPGSANQTAFVNAFNNYRPGGSRGLASGDYFLVFFYGHSTLGHTLSTATGGETSGAGRTEPDEGLYFVNSGEQVLFDDDLTGMFSKLDPGVRKVFINISCFSGGFWGDAQETIGRDLDSLPNMALIAAAAEGSKIPCFTNSSTPFLSNLITNTNANLRGGNPPTLQQLFNESVVTGTFTNATRMGDPWAEGPPTVWLNEPISGEYTSFFAGNDLNNFSQLFVVPEPTALSYLVPLAIIAIRKRADMRLT